MNSESEFQDYKYQKEHFDFAVDATESMNLINKKIAEDEKAISDLKNLLPPLKQKIKGDILQELKNKISLLESGIEQLDNQFGLIVKHESRLIERRARLEEEKIREVEKSKVEIEKKQQEQRFKVMREAKGYYTYSWKHERKSWQAANHPIYFDLGEDYLFEKIKAGLFKKIKIKEFAESHLEASIKR